MSTFFVDVSGNWECSGSWDGKKMILNIPTMNIQAGGYNAHELAQNLPGEIERAYKNSAELQRIARLLPYVPYADSSTSGTIQPIQTDASTAAEIADVIVNWVVEKIHRLAGEKNLREAEDYLAGQQGLWEQYYIWNPPLKFPRHADESNKDRYDPKLELLKWQTKKNHQEWLEKQKQENQEAAGDTKDEKSGDTLVTGAGPEKIAGEYDNIYKKLQADLEENLKNHSEEDKAKARQHLLSILQDTEADLHNHPQGMEWISDPEHHLYAVKRVIDHLNDSTNYNVDYTRAIIHHSAKGLQNILNIPGKIYSYLKHLEVDPDDWKAYQQEVGVARKAAAQGDSISLEALADRELKCRSDPNREIPWQTNLVAGLDKPETEPGKILGWFVELATEGAAIVFLLRAAKLLANLKGVGKGKVAGKEAALVKAYPEGISFRVDMKAHLAECKFTQSGGVSGGHNAENFYAIVKQHNLRIVSDVPTGSPGIRHITYDVPIMEKGVIKPGVYKNQPKYKTVYDPKVISDEQMFALGEKAALQGHAKAVKSGAREYDEIVNGVKIRIYLEKENPNFITSFHPIK